jgi:hypothetical protein
MQPSPKGMKTSCSLWYPFSSNTTAAIKKQHQYLHQQTIPGQDLSNGFYQINGQNTTQSPLGYPPPPSYAGPMPQQGSGGALNPAFTPNPALFGYSRPGSPNNNPMYPNSNVSSSLPDSCCLLHHQHATIFSSIRTIIEIT